MLTIYPVQKPTRAYEKRLFFTVKSDYEGVGHLSVSDPQQIDPAFTFDCLPGKWHVLLWGQALGPGIPLVAYAWHDILSSDENFDPDDTGHLGWSEPHWERSCVEVRSAVMSFWDATHLDDEVRRGYSGDEQAWGCTHGVQFVSGSLVAHYPVHVSIGCSGVVTAVRVMLSPPAGG